MTAAWLIALRDTPDYNLPGEREAFIAMRLVDRNITDQQALTAATALAAKWESVRYSLSNKRGYKRIDLTFINWAQVQHDHSPKSDHGLEYEDWQNMSARSREARGPMIERLKTYDQRIPL